MTFFLQVLISTIAFLKLFNKPCSEVVVTFLSYTRNTRVAGPHETSGR